MVRISPCDEVLGWLCLGTDSQLQQMVMVALLCKLVKLFKLHPHTEHERKPELQVALAGCGEFGGVGRAEQLACAVPSAVTYRNSKSRHCSALPQ